ncbi:MAG: hypothetical protein QOD98_3270 [Nocardioidaceae bacterium]|nr:hypothetical protein [Nocardioidaceae bacterium]
MTTLTAPHTTDTTTLVVPRRRTLVGLAVGFVALFATGFATSQDPQDYDSPATVMKNFDMSRPALTILLAGGIFTGAVLVFFGAALKAALENRTRSWTTSVVGYGFTFGGVTMLIFSLASVWLYHAVDIGDASAVQAITIIDVGAFPALMMLFVTAYTSVGIAAYAGRSLPTWLCAVSVVLGVIAPISIGGFASFTLFPVWLIAVAAMVKLDPK